MGLFSSSKKSSSVSNTTNITTITKTQNVGQDFANSKGAVGVNLLDSSIGSFRSSYSEYNAPVEIFAGDSALKQSPYILQEKAKVTGEGVQGSLMSILFGSNGLYVILAILIGLWILKGGLK